MKKLFKFISVLCLIVVFASVPMLAANAAPLQGVSLQEPAELPSIWDLLNTAMNLGGVALFFAALINAGKQFLPKLFPNDSAPKYNLVFQTISLVVLVILQLNGRADLVPVIDQTAGSIATVLTSILALYYQLYVSRVGHENVLAGLPIIGKSYSGRAAGEPFSAVLEETF